MGVDGLRNTQFQEDRPTVRYECPKAPPHWVGHFQPPILGAVPQFCPWCDQRLDEHLSYLLSVTTGTSAYGD